MFIHHCGLSFVPYKTELAKKLEIAKYGIMNSRILVTVLKCSERIASHFPCHFAESQTNFPALFVLEKLFNIEGSFLELALSLCFVSTFCLRFYSFLYLLYFTCNAQEISDTCTDRNRLGSEHCRRIAMNCRQMFVAVKLNSVIVVMVTYLFANVCLRLMYLLFACTVHFFYFYFFSENRN